MQQRSTTSPIHSAPAPAESTDRAQLERERDELIDRLRKSEASRRVAEAELKISAAEVSRLLRRQAEEHTRAALAEGKLAEAQQLQSASSLQLEQRQTELAAKQVELNEKQAALDAKQGELDAKHVELDELRRRLAVQEDELARRTEQLAALHAAEQQRTQELARERAIVREARARIEQLERELQVAQSNGAHQTARLDQESKLRVAAEARVEQTRATLSFQLGHALIVGFKSFAALRRLPAQLWRLRQEAARRRATKQLKARAAR